MTEIQIDRKAKPLRVLSLSGGGMRGLYSATYIDAFANQVAHRLGKNSLDVGSSFDLIVGTSTGGILACALAAGVPMSEVAKLYREKGSGIFPQKLPDSLRSAIAQIFNRPRNLSKGEAALRLALTEVFSDSTLSSVFDERGIALAIPSVDMTRHASWVFKTGHLANSNGRDDDTTLVNVCLATSAAPLFRSMASIPSPMLQGRPQTFVDGGLWANNPVLVGLVDALEMAQDDQPIEIYCLGTCKKPEGKTYGPSECHRGLLEWNFGGDAAALSIDAQEIAYDHIARMLSSHVTNDVKIFRFPVAAVSASAMAHLALDATDDAAMNTLQDQALADVNIGLSAIGYDGNEAGRHLLRLFTDMKEVTH